MQSGNRPQARNTGSDRSTPRLRASRNDLAGLGALLERKELNEA